MPTAAPAYLGCLAASLQAAEIDKILAGQRALVAEGKEIRLDVRHHRHLVTRLVRNPGCRFSHDPPWTIETAPDLSLREVFTLGDTSITGGTLSAI